MLNLPQLPETLSFTLADHAKLEAPPVFECRPMNVQDVATWSGRVIKADREDGSAALPFIQIFKQFVVRVSQFDVDGEAFDVKNAEHRERLGAHAMIEIGSRIYYHSQMSRVEAGK